LLATVSTVADADERRTYGKWLSSYHRQR